ncbi:nodulation protein NfeD [Allopusillimonas soli]|uniref:Nodulation protein NfeD n=1 Tax=Allopusillimonas soli TaxID=659016 RepID=A0A853FD32_9BURK|nr:nodulation protein NfeD [Allopusillimonas soli]NYT36770.1 nodulation protein NfeD [Allopusillimonas soli]TEA75241.1 nodulation protein NfeD [Allopusillimonas soli]
MSKARVLLMSCCLLLGGWLAMHIAPIRAADTPLVRVLEVRGAINPAISDFIVRGLNEAREQSAALLVLELDTPGGLDTSMRAIVQAILASPVPVATYVGPEGARAASAGAFILYASHVAAMSPASNVGAASPVSIGIGGAGADEPATGKRAQDKPQHGGNEEGHPEKPPAQTAEAGDQDEEQGGSTMHRKVTNDAAAYIRSLAQLRGRNAEFAQKAVTQATSLSSAEALKAGAIDLVVGGIPELLREIDGREVVMANGAKLALHTADAHIERVEPGWRTKLLGLIAHPQVAVILMMIGIYGLFFELASPGAALPGVAGLICLVLGLYAFQMLPVNWAGVGLVALGAILMIAEVFVPSFGALGIGGIAAVVVGGLMLTDTGMPGYDLSLPFLGGLAVASALLVILTGTLAVRSHKRPVVTGRDDMPGRRGVVTSVKGGTIYAQIEGEQWRVRAEEPLAQGDVIKVIAADGLTLSVLRDSEAAGGPTN